MKEIIVKNQSKFPLVGILFIVALIISIILFIDSMINRNEQTGDRNDDTTQSTEIINDDEDINNYRTDKDQNDNSDPEITGKEEITLLSELEYHAWIPTWDFTDAINNINKGNYPLTSVSPVWFAVQEDGSLIDRRTNASKQIDNLDDSINIIPTISLFDPDLLQGILNDQTKFEEHINSIINIVNENDFSGIDIDYEVIYIEDKARYMSLLKELSQRLHNSNKLLSVTVISQWGADNYSSFPETRKVQDYVEISNYADMIRIMCYDYTSASSTISGPIGPIDWIDDVLSYATSLIDSKKIVLGIHLYGYRWNQNGKVTATTYDQITEIQKAPDYKYVFNYTYDEGVANYSIEDQSYTHFFQTEDGVLSRVQLAAEYDLKGVVFWRLGRESTILRSVFSEAFYESL